MARRSGGFRRLGALAAGAAGCLLGLLTPRVAWADLVRLSSGRVLSVETCQFDGDLAVLALRDGGELRIAKTAVTEVLPDEVPYPKAAVDAAMKAAAAAEQVAWTLEGLEALVDKVAAKVGIDRRLAHAVVLTESNYDPKAVSRKGAMGLMQLMPAVAQEFGLANPFDPAKNLEAGLRHLQDLVTRLGTSLGLAAYNAGEGAVSKYGGHIPPYRETQEYVRQVLALSRRP